MILLGKIEHRLRDYDGTCRLIFGAHGLGYEVSLTPDQLEALEGVSNHDLVVFQIEPLTRTLVSAEKYVEEPLQKVEDEPLTDEKPFRCQWCRKACDGLTDYLCDDCSRADIHETSFAEQQACKQRESRMRQEEIARGIF